MPRACSAIGCTNRDGKGPSKGFYTFPRSRPDIYEQWIKNLGRDNFRPSKYVYLCQDHFLPEDFHHEDDYYIQKRRLYSTAVPTVFNWNKTTTSTTQIPTSSNSSTEIPQLYTNVEETVIHQPSEIQTELPNESPVFDSNIEIKEEIYGEEPMDSLNIDNACPVSQFMTPEMLSSLASSEPNCVSPHVIFEDHSYALGKPNETAMEVYLRQKVRRLQSQLRHRDKKIIEQNLIIGEIRIKTSIPVCVESILEKNFSGLILEIMKNELKSRKCSKFRREYSDEIKQFAETCYSISAKAYEYLRPIMNLPHPRNLKSWKSIFDENPPQLVKTEENDDGEGFLLGL